LPRRCARLRTVATHECTLVKRLPRRRCPIAGDKRGARAQRACIDGGAAGCRARRPHARASEVGARQEPRARKRGASYTSQHVAQQSKHAHRAPPKQLFTRRNTRQHNTKTTHRRRHRVDVLVKAAHECGVALATATHAHTTPHQGCAARFAAKQHATCRFRCASKHTQPQESMREHAGKRRCTLRSCQSRTSAAVSNVSVVCEASRMRAPPSAFITSPSVRISARSICCREKEKSRVRSECPRT
jgi:hypothetical protein